MKEAEYIPDSFSCKGCKHRYFVEYPNDITNIVNYCTHDRWATPKGRIDGHSRYIGSFPNPPRYLGHFPQTPNWCPLLKID